MAASHAYLAYSSSQLKVGRAAQAEAAARTRQRSSSSSMIHHTLCNTLVNLYLVVGLTALGLSAMTALISPNHNTVFG